jgi:hypothetical protein
MESACKDHAAKANSRMGWAAVSLVARPDGSRQVFLRAASRANLLHGRYYSEQALGHFHSGQMMIGQRYSEQAFGYHCSGRMFGRIPRRYYSGQLLGHYCHEQLLGRYHSGLILGRNHSGLILGRNHSGLILGRNHSGQR